MGKTRGRQGWWGKQREDKGGGKIPYRVSTTRSVRNKKHPTFAKNILHIMAKTNGNGGSPTLYSKFSLKDTDNLGIELQSERLFHGTPPVQPSSWLIEALESNPEIPLGSEKAKSEFIVAPIVREMVRRNRNKMKVFSGYTFTVDPAKGLTGVCDFVFSKNLKAARIQSPIFFIVETKNESLELGTPQCLAELFAAQTINADGKPIYGVVTFGREWQFYRMAGQMATQDSDIYQVTELLKILGILQKIIDME